MDANRDLALGIDLALTRFVGDDLALTRFVVDEPSTAPLESADSWGSLDLQAVRGGATGRDGDALGLGVIRGRQNLAQALMLRLLTKEGALAALGHADYGSRLVTLIGGVNDATSRNLARLYTLAALQQEPRIRKVLDLRVDAVPGQPQTIRLSFSVLPKFGDEPLSLGLEIAL